jgi:hypothetical protein
MKRVRPRVQTAFFPRFTFERSLLGTKCGHEIRAERVTPWLETASTPT